MNCMLNSNLHFVRLLPVGIYPSAHFIAQVAWSQTCSPFVGVSNAGHNENKAAILSIGCPQPPSFLNSIKFKKSW